jgi:hypothetical protein
VLHIQSVVNWFPVGTVYTWTPTVQYNVQYRVQYLEYTQWSPVWCRVHVDTHVVTTVDFLTSLVAGVVIFSMLGHTAHKLNIPMSEVAKGGQGLAFVAYPEVLYTKEDNLSAKLP